MYDLFTKIKKQVYQILYLGPCNSPQAERAASVYYYNKTRFFTIGLEKEELEALPAVIANGLYLDSRKEESKNSDSKNYNKNWSQNEGMRFLQQAFIYGTGTCELFSMVGAYFLALEFEVDLSIETIYSNNSHTYIRIHTDPEYIFDFWADMVCRYDDNITWAEVHGLNYMRTCEAEYKTNILLNSDQLIPVGDRVMTERNILLREQIKQQVYKEASYYSKLGVNDVLPHIPQ